MTLQEFLPLASLWSWRLNRKGLDFHSKLINKMRCDVANVLIKQFQVFNGDGLFKNPKKMKLFTFCTAHKETKKVNKLQKRQKKKKWHHLYIKAPFSVWTYSLSMEKQVTGPSAVQVAVLKTSLEMDKRKILIKKIQLKYYTLI